MDVPGRKTFPKGKKKHIFFYVAKSKHHCFGHKKKGCMREQERREVLIETNTIEFACVQVKSPQITEISKEKS